MKRTIIAAAFLLAAIALPSISVHASEPYLEPDATLSEGVSRAAAVAAAQYIQLWGYRCDSISSVIPFIFSAAYTSNATVTDTPTRSKIRAARGLLPSIRNEPPDLRGRGQPR